MIVDGRRGFGQLAARVAVEELVRLADLHGVGAAVVRNGNHAGRLGEWVEALADHGHIALAFCNADPTVAPYGGREQRLGTNPLAWAAPRGAAGAAAGHGLVDRDDGRGQGGGRARPRRAGCPTACSSTPRGEPSRDPADLYAGGALLPFGAHKGSGLSVMIQLVGGVLAGTGVSAVTDEAPTAWC